MSNYLPIFLDVTQKRVLLIGGGRVALSKVKGLLPFSSSITVLSQEICEEISSLGIDCIEGAYSKSALNGFDIVYACTSNRELNKQICEDARQLHILVNVVDDPSLSDFISPAVYRREPMTVAVSSDGKDVKRSVAWRDQIKEWITQHDLA